MFDGSLYLRSERTCLGPMPRLTPSDLAFRDIWSQPLPAADRLSSRLWLRAMTLYARRHVLSIEGPLHLLQPENDPFIVAINHNQRLESVLVPALLFFYRGGKPIHFLADWQMMMVPVVASLYRHGQAIIVTQKQARPRFLNIFKRLFHEELSATERARRCLENGRSLGLFPEGTMNRDPAKLLCGRSGTARLALQCGVPVIPLGIRFPLLPPGSPIPDGARMSLHIGDPLHPPPLASEPTPEDINLFHLGIMARLAQVSGKSWHAAANTRRSYAD